MTSSRILLTASILSADLAHLQDEVSGIEGLVDALQVDVMDGHFVPNLTFGAPVLACLKTKLPLDIHLMVTNPAERVDEFLKAGATHITFHAEAVTSTQDRRAIIEKIKKGGATAGIAINPETELSTIEDVLEDVDLVLVMSVHPGFAGQKFIADVLQKVIVLRSRNADIAIQMDGGIDEHSARSCVEAGANNLVAASAIFKAKDRKKAIAELRASMHST